MRNFCLLLLVLCFFRGFSQSVQIVDAETKEPIPYANISINNDESLISNAEGYFSVPSSRMNSDAILVVSYMGYNNYQLSLKNVSNKSYVINLIPATYSLDEVVVPNKRPDPQQLMAEVKKRAAENYKTSVPSKSTVFFRTSSTFKPSTFNFEIDKSSGFNKNQLAKTNADLKKFSNSLISSPPQLFTDILGNYYTGSKQADGKTAVDQKFEVIKATRLNDENRSTDMEDLQKGFGKIVLQHLDSTKYYRIKSGWFGSKDTLTLRKDGMTNKKQKKRTNQSSAKSQLTAFLRNHNPANGKLDFITNYDYYDFVYEGAQLSPENTFIYILSFKPRKGKAKFNGKIYISETDFGVVRTDFALADGKTLGGINVKLLLGVKASDNHRVGTLLYKKNDSDKGYHLHYASLEEGQYAYINRPLKFIEISKEDKDVVAFDLKIELNSSLKTEFLTMSTAQSSQQNFDKVKEDEFTYIQLKKYNPSIWKQYNVIEPVEEMKRFQVLE